MNRLFHVLIFVFINLLGFMAAPACYLIGLFSGALTSESASLDPAAVKTLLDGVIITWMICAVFSLSSFFIKGTARVLFLAAPVVLPMAYGLKLLFFSP